MAFGLFVGVALIPTGALRSLWMVQAAHMGEMQRARLLADEILKGGTPREIDDATDKAVAAATASLSHQFSTLDVLLYGAFFAVILTALTVPVLALWRSVASMLVDRSCPLRHAADVTSASVEQRGRLEAVLHLDIGILRNPVTIFSVLTPLVTAVLAAFVPELKA
jgi:hypothetical protein